MAQLILFRGGGDGDGIIIEPNGRIHRIPPLEPALFEHLLGVAALAQAQQAVADKHVARELEPLLTKVTDLLVSQLGKMASSVDKRFSIDEGIVFADIEEGFTCGNGRPPVPFPHHGTGAADRGLID